MGFPIVPNRCSTRSSSFNKSFYRGPASSKNWRLAFAIREAHLADQQTQLARQVSRYEQNEARIADAAEEVRRLRDELAVREAAAEARRNALVKAHKLWEHDRTEVFEKLNALMLTRQGAVDAADVTPLCQELSRIRDLYATFRWKRDSKWNPIATYY